MVRHIARALLVGVAAIAICAGNWPAVHSDSDTGRESIGAVPHVATNAALALSAKAKYPSGVWRDEYTSGDGMSPLYFTGQTGTCASHSLANDGASCTNGIGGNSWLAHTTISNPARLGTTVYVDSLGLNVAKGRATEQNGGGNASQFVYHGAADPTGHESSPLYTRNEYTGNDSAANPNGLYGTIWYQGTNANLASAFKGNFYTYDSSRTLTGSLPRQTFGGSSIGTLPIAAGVYGRVAHYLPGTIHVAGSVYADGLYNIPLDGAVDNWANFLTSPPYVQATANFVLLVTGSSCSPSCYTATIQVNSDPFTVLTGALQDINLKPAGRLFLQKSSGISAALSGTTNAVGVWQYMTSSFDSYRDAVNAGAGVARNHLRSYNNGTYPDLLWDENGKLSQPVSLLSSALSGSSNAAGIHSYMTTNARMYFDAIASGANTTQIHFRSYAGSGVFNDSFFDAGGRFNVDAIIMHHAFAFGSIDTCNSSKAGSTAYVIDSSTITWGANVTGSGSNKIFAFCNGTNWTVAAK